MPPEPPKIDGKLQVALEAIDQTRLKFDQAIKNGDEIAAENLLKTIQELAQKFDQLTSKDADKAPC